jgi:hypothetical protein
MGCNLFPVTAGTNRESAMTQVIIPPDSTLYRTFEELIDTQRLVFIVGLPGVGKSLLAQQLALMAHAAGRNVHLLQWDVARQPFVSHEYVLKNYPEVDGITDGVVRKAIGLWARSAIGPWYQRHPDEAGLLIGEVPLIGNRLVELVQRDDDDAEPILGSSITRFVVPVPSRELRRVMVGKREASSANPQHEREQADAIPQVLQAAWLELYRIAQLVGITSTAASRQPAYDPDVYQSIYSMLLKYRYRQVVPLAETLPTENQSVYDLWIDQRELAPTMEQVRGYIAQVEQRYPDRQALTREIDQWYVV